MKGIDWESEPDIEGLRQSYALTQTDPKQAFTRLEQLANQGSIMSAWYLAEFHLHGNYTEKNIEKSKIWYTKAKNNGLLHAAYMLGDINYRAGDYGSAFQEFSFGLERKYLPSIYRIAKMYENGIGVEQNFIEARKLFRVGAKSKHLFSKRDLAGLYIKGCFGKLLIPVGFFILISLVRDILVYGVQRWRGQESSITFAFPHELSRSE